MCTRCTLLRANYQEVTWALKIFRLFSLSLIFKWSSRPIRTFVSYMVMVRAQCWDLSPDALFICTLLSIDSLILRNLLRSMDSAKQNDRCGLTCIAYRGSANHCGGHLNRRFKEDKDNSSRAITPAFLDTLSRLLYHFTPRVRENEEDRYFDMFD